jgi:DNA-binding MarR family transcriptional regulator
MPALRILERLINSPEPVGPSQLAQEMHLTRAAATQTLQVLERRGLIERLAHPTDGRMSGARVTPEGVKRYRRFIPIVRYRQARACEALSEAEQRRLLSMLQKMLDHSIGLEFPNLGPPEP